MNTHSEAKFKSESEILKKPLTSIEKVSCSEVEATLLGTGNVYTNGEHSNISYDEGSNKTAKTVTLQSNCKNGNLSCNSLADVNSSFFNCSATIRKQGSNIEDSPKRRTIACEVKTEVIAQSKLVPKSTRFSNIAIPQKSLLGNKSNPKSILRNSSDKNLMTRKISNCSAISKQSVSSTNKLNMYGPSLTKSKSSLTAKQEPIYKKTPSCLESSTSSKIPKPKTFISKNQTYEYVSPPKPAIRTPISLRIAVPKTPPKSTTPAIKAEIAKKDNKSQGDPVQKPETKTNAQKELSKIGQELSKIGHELSVSSKNELGNTLEQKNKDKKLLCELEEKLNMMLSNCIAKVKKSHNINNFHDILEKIEHCKKTPSERLNGIVLLLDKFFLQSSVHEESIRVLQNEITMLKESINHMKTNDQNRNNLKDQIKDEIIKKDYQLLTLKEELEKSKRQIETIQKSKFNLSIDLQCANEERSHFKNLLDEEKNKGEELEKLKKMNLELQKNLDSTSIELQDSLSGRNQLLQTTKRYFEEVIDLKSQVKELSNVNLTLSEKLDNFRLGMRSSNEKIQSAELQIENYKKLLENQSKMNTEDIKTELARFQQAQEMKDTEMEKMTAELQQSKSKISELSEQVRRDQQLLAVRSTLIVQMQKSEIHNRESIDDLYTQMSEKNRHISELNNELRLRSEDFQELFGTLAQKQIELQTQSQTLRQLHESNERNQLLRVSQEEKIAALEDEIVRLKHYINLKIKK